MPTPRSPNKTPTRKQATPAKPSAPAATRKGKPATAEPPKRSPAVRVLPPAEWPKSHPLVGKSVTATVHLSVFGKTKTVKGRVEAGDAAVIKIGPLWYFTSSVSFA